MALSNSAPLESCAICNKDAFHRCAGCAEGVDISGSPTVTWYCSKACQTAHWPTHKIECKDTSYRKHFYRAGDLLQQCFHLFSRKFWNHTWSSWERDETGKLYAWMHGPDTGEDEKLYLFPDECDDLPDREKHAVLATQKGPAALLTFHQLVKAVLRGSCTNVEEIMVDAKQHAVVVWNTKKVDGEPLEKPGDVPETHQLYRVTLKDGNVYALDLTSAQFGVSPVMPFDRYQAAVVHRFVSGRSFGRCITYIQDGCQTRAMFALVCHKEVVDGDFKFDSRMMYYEEMIGRVVKRGGTMGARDLKSPEVKYQRSREDFLQRFTAGLALELTELKSQDGFAGDAARRAKAM
ncbi:hypothetical protein LTR95_010338 [Oleoguttula sp. CCFEE 5521]